MVFTVRPVDCKDRDVFFALNVYAVEKSPDSEETMFLIQEEKIYTGGYSAGMQWKWVDVKLYMPYNPPTRTPRI